jgi:hypothetical protein
LALLVHEIRDEWDERGVLSVLRKLSDQPMADVSAAAIFCAYHRTDQRTPACIALSGEHWHALARMAGQTPTAAPAARCADHGQVLPCLRCDALSRGPMNPLPSWRELRDAAQHTQEEA